MIVAGVFTSNMVGQFSLLLIWLGLSSWYFTDKYKLAINLDMMIVDLQIKMLLCGTLTTLALFIIASVHQKYINITLLLVVLVLNAAFILNWLWCLLTVSVEHMMAIEWGKTVEPELELPTVETGSDEEVQKLNKLIKVI